MTTPLDLVADNRKWLRLHEHNKYQAEAARRITVLLAEVERLRADRDEQGRFLSAVADAVRTTGLSVSEVLSALGVKTERDRLAATVDRVRALHRPVDIEPSETICGHCSYRLPNGRYFGKVAEWPCPTIAAIEGTGS